MTKTTKKGTKLENAPKTLIVLWLSYSFRCSHCLGDLFHFYLRAVICDKCVFFSCCRKMFSISESIDDMEAYTQLTDHVYHQILYSDAAASEVISADKYYLKLLGCPVGTAIHSLNSWGLCCGIIAGFKAITRKNWSNLILPCSKQTRLKSLVL